MASRTGLLVALALAAPATLWGQGGHDVQLHGLALFGGREYAGAGIGAGLRFGRSLRAAVLAGGGWEEPGQAAARGELLATFHLTPFRRTAPGIYAGAGAAAQLSDSLRGYLVLLVGVEARPAGGGGWFAEAGVGGGVRLAVGYRLIRQRGRRR